MGAIAADDAPTSTFIKGKKRHIEYPNALSGSKIEIHIDIIFVSYFDPHGGTGHAVLLIGMGCMALPRYVSHNHGVKLPNFVYKIWCSTYDIAHKSSSHVPACANNARIETAAIHEIEYIHPRL